MFNSFYFLCLSLRFHGADCLFFSYLRSLPATTAEYRICPANETLDEACFSKVSPFSAVFGHGAMASSCTMPRSQPQVSTRQVVSRDANTWCYLVLTTTESKGYPQAK